MPGAIICIVGIRHVLKLYNKYILTIIYVPLYTHIETLVLSPLLSLNYVLEIHLYREEPLSCKGNIPRSYSEINEKIKITPSHLKQYIYTNRYHKKSNTFKYVVY